MRSLPAEFTTSAGAIVNQPVFLFEITVDKSGTIWRICTGNIDIVWGGNTYTHYDVQHGGLVESLEGDTPQFDLTIDNVPQTIGSYVLQNTTNTTYGLRDKQVRIILIFMQQDSTTKLFEPLTDPSSYVDFYYQVSSSEFKPSGKMRQVILHCKSKIFTENAQIPGRTIGRDICWWAYRSIDGCKYQGASIGSPIIYQTGTISINDTETIVTGSGTTWLGNVASKDILQNTSMAIQLPATTGSYYEILTVDTNTQLTLVSAYSGSNLSGAAYIVRFSDFCSRILSDSTCGCLAHQNTQNFGAFPGVPDSAQVRIV